MSGDRPEDPWSEVLEQVQGALGEAGLTEPDETQALLDGVRSALDSIVGLDTENIRRDSGDALGPDVVVVEGGRGHDEPRSDRVGPDLRVAAESDDDGWPEVVWGADVDVNPSTRHEASGSTSRPRVVVRGVNASVSSARSTRAQSGRIRVEPEAAAQTIFVGAEARSYRLACHEGGLSVHVDGALEIPLPVGRTVDVDARQIAVSAVGQAPARGEYWRVGEQT